MNRYNPLAIESKWQKIWEDSEAFKADEASDKPKKFLAEMFPYPSGAGLHVGHVRNFTIVDVLARYYAQKGFNVLRPFGYDTFGLPAENYAIKTGVSPKVATDTNVKNFRNQLKKLGYAIDWSREINTSSPEYYKWTQWCFLQLYKKGLAYQKESYQWWCPVDQTVLANEQVENGHCWRCGSEVEKKKMKQWFFKITAYADELLECVDELDWPEKIKVMQKNWIGRSEGAEIDFETDAGKITVFTTRPDTIYGATFLVLAPEHPLIRELTTENTKEAVEEYCRAAIKKSEIERQESKEKTGVFTGAYAVNPATKEKIPVWVADYVLMGYGTGAIMAVPAGDERDREFAEKFDLPVVEITKTPEKPFGTPKTTYRMRDWLISRQRYWGCPIPIAYDKDGNPHPIPEDQLPVMIPEVDDFKPDNSGHSALAKATDWLKVEIDGEEMTRETDTLDGYACSSWYLWRYASPHDAAHAWHPEAVKYWEPLDVYCGGDHAVAHLLYIRFWCKFFADEGKLPFREPIVKLLYNGYINAPDGKKMSKSKGNVIDPLDVINDGYGADTLRTYEMFIGPYDQDAAWNPRSVGGVYRFLNRCWTLVFEKEIEKKSKNLNLLHKTIKKVTEDIERAAFNTAISTLMEFVNELYKTGASEEDLVTLAKLLKPFAPHLASEMLEQLRADDAWPTYDEEQLVEELVEVVVQVNGKLRAKLAVPVEDLEDEEKVTEMALSDGNVRKFAAEPKKTIYVKKAKLLNIVA
ncbi:leucine--tRNA ligase [Candidatus Saccharibacteria bacterium]|nr:leucine--tRNA ligase [Candidatus Saccharibacteria bacterium]MBR6123080.1 leucine--tRNA ligase [Candidatus Saccharibacteria bacterium]